MGKGKKKVIDNEDEVELRRLCKYIGSFAINMMKSEERQNLMNERLEELKHVKKGIQVLMLITTEGIKIYDEKETSVKMAHAITRIAFSTCSPDTRLFAYVARSSTSLKAPPILQAHVFKTKKASHAQQMSALVSKAFRIVFAMATIDRNSKTEGFENDAQQKKEDSPLQNRRRWAKKEIARGHDLSEHAQRARKYHPLAMIPGKADPVDTGMLPSRKISQTEFDNRMIAQSRQRSNGTERIYDAISENVQINRPQNSRELNQSSNAATTVETQLIKPRIGKDVHPENETELETSSMSGKSLAESTNDAMQEFIEGRVAGHKMSHDNETSNAHAQSLQADGKESLHSTDSDYEDMHAGQESPQEMYVEKEQVSGVGTEDKDVEKPMLYENVIVMEPPSKSSNEPPSTSQDLPARNEELSSVSNEPPSTSQDFPARNEELSSVSNEPSSARHDSSANNEELASTSNEPSSTNEEIDTNKVQSSSETGDFPTASENQPCEGEESLRNDDCRSTGEDTLAKTDDSSSRAEERSSTNENVETKTTASKQSVESELPPAEIDRRPTTPYMFLPSSPKHSPVLERKRAVTVTDEQLMRDSHWYQPGLSREISEEILANEKEGSFFIRDSTSNPGSYAMTVRIPKIIKPSGIGNILIQQTPEGDYKIPGFHRSFPSLPMLVAYYASFQDELPVKLRLTNENPLFDMQDGGTQNGDQVDGHQQKKVDPDFERFASCEGIMRELSNE